MKKILLSMMVLAALASCSNKASNQPTGSSEAAVENADSAQVANIPADEAKANMQAIAEAANKLISEEKDAQMATSASVEFDGQNFIYNFEIDETEMTIAELNSAKDELQSKLKKDLEEKKNYQVIKDNLKALNGKVIYQYVGSHTKKTSTITIEP